MTCADGIPVGAIVAPVQHVDSLKKALRRAGWLKSGINVTPYVHEGPMVRAVHVSPEGAIAMTAGDMATMPRKIAALLQDDSARWVPGLRVRSIACHGAKDARQCFAHPEPVTTCRDSAPVAPFTFSELFAGIGGFRVALDKLGGRSVFASEIDEPARQVYAANFRDVPSGDIVEIEASDIGPHDILTGGFPCQPFSNLGQKRGFEDPRGLLFHEIVRVLNNCQPRAFILENVANLVYMDGGRPFKRILAELGAVGYRVDWRLINNCVVLPQQRVRLYIVGFRRGVGGRIEAAFDWPELPVFDTELGEVLEGIEVDEDPQYMLTEGQQQKFEASGDCREDPRGRIAQLNGIAQTLTSSYRSGSRSEFVFREGASRPRYFTVRECARLQGFPEVFMHCGAEGLPEANRAYHQLGNAVCPIVVAAIAASVLDTLGVSCPTSKFAEKLEVPASCCPRRRRLVPALELLVASSPSFPDRIDALLSRCVAFLRCDLASPPGYNGCGAALLPRDIEVLRGLLRNPSPRAKTCALFAIGRVAYVEAESGLSAESSKSVVASGLLPLVTSCLQHESTDVERQAIVTLKILAGSGAVVDALATETEALRRLNELAQPCLKAGARVLGGTAAKQARDVLLRTRMEIDSVQGAPEFSFECKLDDI